MNVLPTDATREELYIVYVALSNIKHEILQGTPSGLVIDAALREALEKATAFDSDSGH